MKIFLIKKKFTFVSYICKINILTALTIYVFYNFSSRSSNIRTDLVLFWSGDSVGTRSDLFEITITGIEDISRELDIWSLIIRCI